MIYDGRRFTKRVAVPHGPGDRAYEYHPTPLTTALGHVMFWLFWGGLLLFALQALWQRRAGAAWFLAKVAFVPVYLFILFILFFHVD